MIDLDALEALYGKATPGEWWHRHTKLRKQFSTVIDQVEAVDGTEVVHWAGFDSGDATKKQKHANAALIAALHNAFPALLALARKGQQSEWIPVSERLPEKYHPVALLNVDRFESGSFDRNIQAAGYLDNAASPNFYWSIRGERATMLESFTHWMPLPASPQKESGK